MTKSAKVWTGVLIVGVVAVGAIIANQARADRMAPTSISEASTPDDTSAIAPARMPARTMPVEKTAVAEPLVVSPELADVVKPLLQPGTDLTMASEGFDSRETFVATAHAAKNLKVPFVLLKDRVTVQHMTLTKAIGDVKPEVNAKVEADRATLEARSDLARSGLN